MPISLKSRIFLNCFFDHLFTWGFSGGANGKESACQYWRYKRCWFDPSVGKIPWRRKRQPTPVFSPGKSHGQRSLAGYSLQVHKESDTTKWLNTHTHTHISLFTYLRVICIFFPMNCLFTFISLKKFLPQDLKITLLITSRSFIVLPFTFRSKMPVIWLCYEIYLPPHMDIQLIQHHYFKDLYFPLLCRTTFS